MLPPADRLVLPVGGKGVHSPAALLEVLSDARTVGFLGPGPLETHVRHAEGFALVARSLVTSLPGSPHHPRVVDLGSGGGLPGLVVAERWPDARLVLVEANGRRAAFLERAVVRLGLEDRVEVVHDRAERLGREAGYRAGFDVALARSFGPPAAVAECAAPLLRPGGWLVVSEPPPSGASRGEAAGDEAADGTAERGTAGGPARWPREPLAQLGLEVRGVVRRGFDYQTLLLGSLCPSRFPRRVGVPAKRPLF